MTRIVNEELVGYLPSVEARVMRPVVRDGQVVFVDGQPLVAATTTITFTSPADRHRIVVVLPDDIRDQLLRDLTGGIVVASEVPEPPRTA